MTVTDDGFVHATPETDEAPPAAASPVTVSSLDPSDWQRFRRLAHGALDDIVTHLATLESRPVWQPMPPDVRERFRQPLPRRGDDFAGVLADVAADVVPYVTGNTHPMFMGWVHGAGTPYGMVAEMIAAGLNANCGGRDHVGIEIERQITRWSAEMLGFPEDSSGLFVTGTSMANFLGLLVARDAALGHGVRKDGLRAASGQLTAYASAEAHGCIGQAMELSGIGSAHLRAICADATGAMRLDALRNAVAQDRAAGHHPFLLVGTAGTVNTGAIDPLDALADLARAESLWFHVDGAFGAMAALSPALRPLLAGIERAHSVAFDFHKWAHVPYDAGFLLVRDAEMHRGTFASPAAYLSRLPRGLAAGDTWPCDLGPDLSRGMRALKTWMTIRTLGADAMGAAIETSCRMARRLAARLDAHQRFEVLAPVSLNIVVWRIRDADDALNAELLMDLHERGIAAPSLTRIGGRPALRAAIVNHRTGPHHIDRLIAALDDGLARLDRRAA